MARRRRGAGTESATARKRPLGAGSSLFAALPLLGDAPFLVANGDVLTDFPLRALKLPPGSLAHLVAGREPGDITPGGDSRCARAAA